MSEAIAEYQIHWDVGGGTAGALQVIAADITAGGMSGCSVEMPGPNSVRVRRKKKLIAMAPRPAADVVVRAASKGLLEISGNGGKYPRDFAADIVGLLPEELFDDLAGFVAALRKVEQFERDQIGFELAEFTDMLSGGEQIYAISTAEFEGVKGPALLVVTSTRAIITGVISAADVRAEIPAVTMVGARVQHRLRAPSVFIDTAAGPVEIKVPAVRVDDVMDATRRMINQIDQEADRQTEAAITGPGPGAQWASDGEGFGHPEMEALNQAAHMHRQGYLNDEEFVKAKARILGE